MGARRPHITMSATREEPRGEEGHFVRTRGPNLSRSPLTWVVSGIPDYRSEGVGLYDRTKHRPIQHMDFMTDYKARRR